MKISMELFPSNSTASAPKERHGRRGRGASFPRRTSTCCAAVPSDSCVAESKGDREDDRFLRRESHLRLLVKAPDISSSDSLTSWKASQSSGETEGSCAVPPQPMWVGLLSGLSREQRGHVAVAVCGLSVD
jgi:hypothetical protein